MALVPLGLVKSVAKKLIRSEGQSIIYRRSTITNNPSTGTPTISNADTPIRAYVGRRSAKFVDGTLIQQDGERLLIYAADLSITPVPGDTVILAATESASARRKVVTVKSPGTQGVPVIHIVEVE